MNRRLGALRDALALVAVSLMMWMGPGGCDDPTGTDGAEAPFALTALYDSIRSYPGGGGVFLVHLEPGEAFAGEVRLSVSAPARLGAEVDRDTLSAAHPMAEVTLRPQADLSPGHHRVTLTATQGASQVKLHLDVEIVEWEVEAVSEHATTEKGRFLAWLAGQDPALAELADQPWFVFQTYPEMLVVEHWTFLSADWEMRLCVHVMIPPHDWAMVRLRRRGESAPLLTGKRETDGSIHVIPVAEYPTFGY